MKRKKTLLFISGEGGHSYEMSRLCSVLDKSGIDTYNLVHLGSPISDFKFDYRYPLMDIRHKTSLFLSIIYSIPILLYNILLFFYLIIKFDVKCVLSTGPGLSIIPSVLFQFFCKSTVVFFESSCMFYSKSVTGHIMSYVANYIIVQNEELLQVYDKSLFLGRL